MSKSTLPRTFLAGLTALAIGAFGALVAVPVAASAADGGVRITEWEYNGSEFIEFTNLGTTPVDLAGWSFSDDHRTVGNVPLGSLGTVAVGESFVISEASAADFRAEWGIPATVKVLGGNSQNLGNGDEINLYDATGALVDRLTYPGNKLTATSSAWIPATAIGNNLATSAVLSTPGDAEGSWTSAGGHVGSPGKSTFGAALGYAESWTPTPGSIPVPCASEAPDNDGAPLAGGVAWPSSDAWTTVDNECQFVTPVSDLDLSGLDIDPAAPNVLWAVKNKSYIYKLVQNGGKWVPATDNGWGTGKRIVFAGGLTAPQTPETSQPDSESITVGPDGALYVTTERDNASNKVSKNTVLRYDPSAAGTPYTNPNGRAETVLEPTRTWDLTTEFQPSVIPAGANKDQANLGFEGITWVPDSYLTRYGFVDQSTGRTYDPAAYPLHGTGLYFLGLEKNDDVYAYALNSDGTFHRVADIPTGFSAYDAPGSVLGVGLDIQWDPDLQRIWVVGDNEAGGSAELLRIGAAGAFVGDVIYNRPASIPNYNLEGFAIAPDSAAVNGEKAVFRSDDGNNGGHSLWQGDFPAGLDLGPQGRAKHTLTFDGNGATVSTASETAFDGDTFAEPTADAGRNGFTLLGWYPDRYGQGPAWDFASDTLSGADVTLYAVWAPVSVLHKSDKSQGNGPKAGPLPGTKF